MRYTFYIAQTNTGVAVNINLNAKLVAAIAQFKAHHDIRYYLNGVYVEPCDEGGALLVATNGHVMGIWHDTTATIERPAILSVSSKLITACTGGKGNRRLVDKFGRLTVIDKKTDAEIYIQPVDKKTTIVELEQYEVSGAFPNWRSVAPVLDKTQVQLFDVFAPEYLRLATDAARIGCGLKFNGVTLRQKEKGSAIVVQFSDIGASGFMAIVMPMRDGAMTKNPPWLKVEKAPEIAKQPSDAAPPDEAKQVDTEGVAA